METTDALTLAHWRRRVAELYAGWRAEAERDPERATREFGAARDELFRTHAQSPLPAGSRARFAGVAYLDYDPALRMTVRVESIEQTGGASPSPLALPSSRAEQFAFRRVGRVRLVGPLSGATLSLFWIEGYAGGLFLPFRDSTSGGDTYAAGRYLLDTVKGADLGGDPAGGELLLDFNMAYHPSCAYDARWNCPLAPPENRLTVAVPAGERLRAS
ncbi:MAG: DUF1684 domain-containing protein [Chloroflexota bacterium]|nr:DUF1684 domain-containing protein [Chloroflexota bacterium]